MKLNFPRIFVTLLVLAAPGFAASADFPNQGLEERIQFWTKVYTQYGEDDVIIHDRIRVNLIYDIAARGEDSSKVAAIRRAFDELRANPESPDSLSTTARQLLETLVAKNIPVTAETLTELRDTSIAVRNQRTISRWCCPIWPIRRFFPADLRARRRSGRDRFVTVGVVV